MFTTFLPLLKHHIAASLASAVWDHAQ